VANNLIYIIHIILFFITPLGSNEILKQADVHAINNSKVKSNFITQKSEENSWAAYFKARITVII
jgi:hypothetical protein